MTWARIDDSFYDHPKLTTLSVEALGLWAAGIAYCNHYLTDGFIPKTFTDRFGSRSKIARVVSELCSKCVWVVSENGFNIVGYLDHNPSKSDVIAHRTNNKTRQNAWRNENRNALVTRTVDASQTRLSQHPVTVPSPLLSSPLQSIKREESPLPPSDGKQDIETPPVGLIPDFNEPSGVGFVGEPEDPRPPDAKARYKLAYENGISGVTGCPFLMPREQEGHLHEAILKYAKRDGLPHRGEKLLRWIELAAKDFAGWCADNPDEAKYYSALAPKGFIRFLNEDTIRQSKARPTPQGGPAKGMFEPRRVSNG